MRALLLPLVLCACTPPEPRPPLLTNEQIIAEVKVCEAAGLDGGTYSLIDSRGKRGVTRVVCEPRKHCRS